jgi:hypothetical protein
MTVKEHAFNRGYTKRELDAAWENAKSKGNMIVNNLAEYGHTWEELNGCFIDQLIKRYGVVGEKGCTGEKSNA